jgi:hypothetical protein
MKLAIAIGLIVGAMLASVLAAAGAKGGVEVTFSGNHVTGSMAAVRASVDTNQRIGCYTYLYAGGTLSVCQATNKNGTTHLCTLDTPGEQAVVANLNDSSAIDFTFDGGGGCTDIEMWTDSYFGGH